MDEIIGIDVSKVTKGFMSGTEYYTKEITRNILDIAPENIKFLLYTKEPLENRLGKLPINTREKVMPQPARLWTQVRLSIEVSKNPPSVLFIPAHTIPAFSGAPIVTTIHDLGFKHYPKLYPQHELWYHNYSMDQAVKKAKKIIAISEFTKQDILKFYPNINEAKIEVIHHGFNRDRYRPLRKTDNLKYQPKYGKYILFVGRLEEKKNIYGMVKAYALLRKEKRITHKLILAGRAKYGFERVQNLIDSLPDNIKNDIILPGYIADEDLPILMREADIFLFTTFFEGFGMPILEAFASGVPVVASNTTSIPEIAGNAALLVNPKKPLEIASACSRIINKPSERQKLVSLGNRRCHQFKWSTAAAKTLKVLRDAENK